MNSANFIGRLTSDGELRFTPSGKAVYQFNLAVDNPYSDNADFIPVVVWGKQAETCANTLRKGWQAGVTGRMQSSSWEKEGQKHYKLECVAENVKFLGAPKGGGSNGQQG